MTTLLCDVCQKNKITLPPDAVVSEFATYTCATCCNEKLYGRTDAEKSEIERIKNEIEHKLPKLVGI